MNKNAYLLTVYLSKSVRLTQKNRSHLKKKKKTKEDLDELYCCAFGSYFFSWSRPWLTHIILNPEKKFSKHILCKPLIGGGPFSTLKKTNVNCLQLFKLGICYWNKFTNALKHERRDFFDRLETSFAISSCICRAGESTIIIRRQTTYYCLIKGKVVSRFREEIKLCNLCPDSKVDFKCVKKCKNKHPSTKL